MTKKIAVVGANGQLGQSLKQGFQQNNPAEHWSFFSSKKLDINDHKSVKQKLIEEDRFDYVINCAAFTAVDLAETQKEKAEETNHLAVENLAKICTISESKLIHISTDFVFDGKENKPLKENDKTNPINFYGTSKLRGERAIQKHLEPYFILRTGWLYSSFGKNFLKTIEQLGKTKDELYVVYDQVGAPTHTDVLVKAILKIIHTESKAYGIYHVANEGVASWYDFAYEILKLTNSNCRLKAILSEAYPTPADRPSYSVLNKNKFKKQFDFEIPHWKESLKLCF